MGRTGGTPPDTLRISTALSLTGSGTPAQRWLSSTAKPRPPLEGVLIFGRGKHFPTCPSNARGGGRAAGCAWSPPPDFPSGTLPARGVVSGKERSAPVPPSWGVLSPAASPTAAYGEGGLSACDKTPHQNPRRRDGLWGPMTPAICAGAGRRPLVGAEAPEALRAGE